jgi:hypothetical protein
MFNLRVPIDKPHPEFVWEYAVLHDDGQVYSTILHNAQNLDIRLILTDNTTVALPYNMIERGTDTGWIPQNIDTLSKGRYGRAFKTTRKDINGILYIFECDDYYIPVSEKGLIFT